MSDPGEGLAAAASGMVGAPFRLHGRDPATGLDCIGLVSAALAAVGGRPVTPSGYGLRNLDVAQWLPLAGQSGLVAATAPARAGDVQLVALGFAQHHLVILADADSVIHAHAALRRVVRQPRDPAWRVRATWRLASPAEG